jgi:hypothetical protein
MGRASPLCPSTSNVDLLRDCKSIVNLDPEIPGSAFDAHMAEQKLHRAQVAGATVDQSRRRHILDPDGD